MLFRRTLLDGLKTGLALAATTTAAIMLFGKRDRGSPWVAVNAITHLINGRVDGAISGDRQLRHTRWMRRTPRRFLPRQSTLGLALNGAAMITWGVLYEGALALTGARSNPLSAGLATAAIWTVDYRLLPPRLSPGIERVLGLSSIVSTYAILGATLAASSAWRTPRALPVVPLDETREEAWFV